MEPSRRVEQRKSSSKMELEIRLLPERSYASGEDRGG